MPAKPFVPENVQKRVARDTAVNAALAKERAARRVAYKAKRSDYLARAQKYQAEYAAAERALVNNKRQARAQGGFYVEPEAKVLLIIRIRGVNQLHPDVKKILRLLRLRQIHNATLMRCNKATLNMLKKVEPFVTFGYPNRKTVESLVYKRGFLKLDGQRVPITSNNLVERALGKVGCVCTEDVVNQLFTVGENFKTVNNGLWPFKLSNPRGGFAAKRHSFQNGGAFGNREVLINELAQRMI